MFCLDIFFGLVKYLQVKLGTHPFSGASQGAATHGLVGVLQANLRLALKIAKDKRSSVYCSLTKKNSFFNIDDRVK